MSAHARRRHARTFALALCCASALVSPALAQPGAPASNEAQTVDTIIVTAQRREERQIEVPVSLTVFSAEAVEKAGIHTLTELNGLVPNVTIDADSVLQIRGIRSFTRNIGFEASSAVYVDGVYQGRSQGNQQDLLDISSVEVLRGPQGTLFGKNSPAGAVNITTLKPGPEFKAMVLGEAGDRDLRRVSAYVAGPLVGDSLFFKVAAFGAKQDGPFTNRATGSTLDNLDYRGARATLRGLAGETELILSGDVYRSRNNPWIGGLVTGFGSIPGRDRRDGDYDFDGRENIDREGVSFTVNHPIGDLDLTSITALRAQDYEFGNDSDGTTLDAVQTDFHDSNETFSQELRLSSPAGNRVGFVAGLFYFHQTADSDRAFTTGPDFSVVLGLPPGLIPSLNIANGSKVETESYAAFGQVDVDITEKLGAFVGIRYTKEDKDLRFQQGGGTLFGYPNLTVSDSLSDDNWSPTVGITYAIRDDFRVYAKASRGYKSGGFNPDLVTTAPIPFGPETLTTFEAGAKGVFFDRTTSIEVAVFDTEYQDLQISRFLGGFLGTQIVNAGSARIRGFEADVTSRPIRNLELNAGVGFLDTEFEDYDVGGGLTFNGNELPGVSRWNLFAAARYELDNGLFGRLEATHRSSSYLTEANDSVFRRPSFTIVDAQVGWRHPDDTWEVTLFGDNIFDEDVIQDMYTSVLPPPSNNQRYEILNHPRTFGIRLRFKR